jgi:RimJ/RimL family protein N-acetyltransferase
VEHIIFREGTKVALAVNDPQYLEFLIKALNDPNVTQYLSRRLPMFRVEEKEFLESTHKRVQTDMMFIILVKDNAKEWQPIGTMGLHKIDHLHGTAITGAFIADSRYQNGGYGSEAKMLLLQYAFDWLHLRMVLSDVYATNPRSIAYSERCGYEVVGIIPNYKWHAGRYHDEVTLSITEARFRKVFAFYQKYQRVPHRNELPKVFKKK